MGLGAPLALLLLSALSLPWLVHRMRQRDIPTVYLPTVALLQRAMAVTQRRRSLQDLLLMLTRMALIVLLTLGLAAPFVNRGVAIGDGRPQSVVLVVDDSMSMQRYTAGVNGTPLWHKARDRALAIVESLPSTSQVAVVAAGRTPRTLAALASVDSSQAARDALAQRFTGSDRGTDLEAAVNLAEAMLAVAQHEQRRVVVLSDFAGSGSTMTNSDRKVAVEYEAIETDPNVGNVAIAELSARQDHEHPGGYHVRVDVRAFGATPRTVRVRLRSQDKTLRQEELALNAAHAEVELTLSAADVTDQEVVVADLLVEDALAADNQRSIALRDPGALRVLLVNGDPRPTHSSDELHFLSRALPLHKQDALPLTLDTVDAHGMQRVPLDNLDLIWLANVQAPTPATAERLLGFVRAGGALVISVGDRLEPAPFNAALRELLPGRLESVETLQTASGVDFATEDLAADPWGIAVESVGHAVTTQRAVIEATGHVSLRYADGVPALVHHSVGRGRVALWTTSIDGDWTDLPYRPGFLALTLSLLGATLPNTREEASARVIDPGGSVKVALPSEITSAVVRDPSGSTHALPLEDAEGAMLRINGDVTQQAGAYTVEVTDTNGVTRALPRAGFVVAPPLDESNLALSSPPASADIDDARTTQLTQTRHALDNQVLAWVLPLFAIEALLRMRMRRRRSAAIQPGP